MKKHRSFRAGLAALWLASAAAPAAVVLDAPGYAATEGAAVAARGGEPGSAWRLADWRGREVGGAVGASVAGLPAEPFAVAPGACAAFACEIAPETADDAAVLSLRGVFGGCADEWETRYVDVPPDADLSAVTLLRVGANPQGSRLTLWVRNLQFLKPTDRPSP